MRKQSEPFRSFVARLDEIERLVVLAVEMEKVDAIGQRREINALCRGAVVLLCSHLEAYIKELGECALESLTRHNVPKAKLSPQFFYFLSQTKISNLRETTDPSKIAELIFDFLSNDLEHWSREEPFTSPLPTETFNIGFANPAYGKIQKYFKRFGYADYKAQLAKKLKAKNPFVTNAVEQLVDTRNKIAHGDPLATKTPGEVVEMVSTIKSFCSTTDVLFAKWWQAQYCELA